MASIDSLEINITASSDKASDAISKLVDSLEKLDQALEKLNIKDFSTQMAKLSDSMTKVGDQATNSGEKIKNVSTATNLVANAFRSAATSTGGFLSSLKNLIPHTKSLTSLFMGLYAKLWLVRKLFNAGLKAITYASDLTEVENVVAHTFENMSYKIEDFSKTSIQKFGLSELAAKTYASQFQSMLKAMGITTDQVKAVNRSMAMDASRTATAMAAGYELVSNEVADMSINLTKLAADMASFYNQESATVASRLAAGVISGQARALRSYGTDLSMATLQEFALSKGIQQNVKDMTQAQKTMLRYQYVMERLSHVQGDFSRTIYTWHNQMQILKQSLQQLGGIIGKGLINAFKPAIIKLNSAMNTIIKLVEKGMNAIGKLLGWQIEIQEVGTALEDLDDTLVGGGGSGGGGGLADATEDAADGADDLADGLNDAKDAAKKLKDYTFGIDELNIFKPDDIEDTADALDDVADATKKAKAAGGDLSDVSGGGAGANVSGGGVTFKPYESDIESWYELGYKISEAIANALDGIDWRTIKQKAEDAAYNLAQLLNGAIDNVHFWQAMGRTIAEGLNTVLTFANTFFDTTHWFNLGYGLAELINTGVHDFDWELLGDTIASGLNAAVQFFLGLGWHIDFEALGVGLATAINQFFDTFEFDRLAKAINVWVDKLEKFISGFLKTLDPEKIFNGLAEFFATLEPDTVLAIIGVAVAFAGVRIGKAIGKLLMERLIESLATKIAGFDIIKIIKDTIGAKLVGLTIHLNFSQATFVAESIAFNPVVNEILDDLSSQLNDALPDFWYDFLNNMLGGAALGGIVGTIAFPGAGTIVGIIVGGIIGAFSETEEANKLKDTIETWLNDDVAPFFTAEKWTEIGEGIKTGLDNAWFNFTSWWELTGVPDWWDNHVAPWFTLDKWKEVAADIKSGIGAAFDEFVNDWKTRIQTWWDDNVAPWFDGSESGKWHELGANLTAGLKNGIESGWDAIKSGAKSLADVVVDTITGRDAWDENSPSKTAESIADYFVEGLMKPFVSFKDKLKILMFSMQLIGALREYLNEDTMGKVGGDIVGYIIGGMTESLASSIPTLQDTIATYINTFLYEFLPVYGDLFLYEMLPEFMNTLFNEILPPFFGLEMWEPLFTSMSEMFNVKFDNFREWFMSSMQTWWTENVEPWFEEDLWKEVFMHVEVAAEESFTAVRDVIAEKIHEAEEAVAEACASMMEMISSVSEAIDGLMSAISGAMGSLGSFSGFNIGIQGFATGGYPTTGSLFYAGESGAELVGSVNGRTAVTSNGEITGIRDAVVATGQAETQMLAQIIGIAQALLDKDPVVLGDRDIAMANKRGQSQLGLGLIS